MTEDVPVPSARPTPRTSLDHRSLTINGEVDALQRAWDGFLARPSETVTVDIHGVTKWSKLDTTWRGVAGRTLTAEDEPGFWETNGHLDDGDPWQAQRYWGD